jgi:uncharacterized protein (DUF2141 family)
MKKLIFCILYVFLPFIIYSVLFSQEEKGNIKIEVSGFKSDDGKARILIFSLKEKDGFPSDQKNAYLKKIISIENQKVQIEIKDIPFGEYAISVHHDINNDGKVNKNWIGIPKEGLGCSNDAKGNYGPPSYNQAKFILNSKQKILRINIVNP